MEAATEKPRAALAPPSDTRRLLGQAGPARSGPTLMVMSGIHGNEPAGVLACRRVLDELAERNLPLRGRIIGFAGNLPALQQGVRYLDKDLNRSWTPEAVAALATADGELETSEDREMVGILTEISRVLEEAMGEVYFLDLHTCSAAGHPFLTLGDTLRNRRFARGIPLPVVMGLEEQVDGSLLEYLNNLGCVTLGVEGGQHRDSLSVDRLASVVWFAMVSAGLLVPGEIEDLPRHRKELRAESASMPRVVEVYDRHPTTCGDGFEMLPGYANIHPVGRGQLLATDERGEYRAPENGLVLLPRYQGQGDDGFFLAREVHAFWLRVSSILRRLGIPRVVGLLPGVERVEGRQGAYEVDLRVARFFPMQILHLLGFRKIRRREDHLFVSRRDFDLRGPDEGVRLGLSGSMPS